MGKVKVTIPDAKGKRRTVAKGRYTIDPGERLRLKLRVTKKSQKRLFRLRRKRKTTVTLRPTTDPPVRAPLTLTAPVENRAGAGQNS